MCLGKDYDVGFLRLVFFIVFALVYCYGLAIIVHGLKESILDDIQRQNGVISK